MTLVLNEIHLLDGLSKTMVVAAADRRISRPDGSYDCTQRKLFPISRLNGAISYFGLASVPSKGTPQYLSDWLGNFIRTHSAPDLHTFARNLRDALHRVIPSEMLEQYPSGFHICGYNNQRLPEFWFLTNIGGMEGFKYVDFKPQYNTPSPDFLERDATKLGWDGVNPRSARNAVWTYRNGDFRAHVAAWESLDDIFKRLFEFPDFQAPTRPEEYREWVKFKFEVIAYFYKKWAKKDIIARPIDVMVLTSPVN